MKRISKVLIPNYEKVVIEFICDTCGRALKDTSWGKLKPCAICKKDVCGDCAIVTDHWYLENGSFAGDYPDYYCPSCWKKGEKIREEIMACRERETKLWEEWHQICKN